MQPKKVMYLFTPLALGSLLTAFCLVHKGTLLALLNHRLSCCHNSSLHFRRDTAYKTLKKPHTSLITYHNTR